MNDVALEEDYDYVRSVDECILAANSTQVYIYESYYDDSSALVDWYGQSRSHR